jgi:hypothetical protein
VGVGVGVGFEGDVGVNDGVDADMVGVLVRDEVADTEGIA